MYPFELFFMKKKSQFSDFSPWNATIFRASLHLWQKTDNFWVVTENKTLEDTVLGFGGTLVNSLAFSSIL